jgi:hypothetical protein
MTTRMRTVGLLLVAFAGLAPFYPAAAAPSYRMSLDVDYAEGTFQGDVTVLCENRTPIALDEIFFRLYGNADALYGSASIEVTSAVIAGNAAPTALFAEDTVLWVSLARPLSPGESIEVRLAFQGRAARASEVGFATETEYGLLTKSPEVLTLTAFYPSLAPYTEEGWAIDPVYSVGDAVFADAASYDVSLVVDPDVTVIPRADTTSLEPDGRVRLSFARTEMRDFPLVFVAGERTPLETSSSEIVLRSWFSPRHAEAAAVALERGATAVGIYSALFGILPYACVDIVEAPLQRAAGVECSGLFLVAGANAASPQDPFFDVIDGSPVVLRGGRQRSDGRAMARRGARDVRVERLPLGRRFRRGRAGGTRGLGRTLQSSSAGSPGPAAHEPGLRVSRLRDLLRFRLLGWGVRIGRAAARDRRRRILRGPRGLLRQPHGGHRGGSRPLRQSSARLRLLADKRFVWWGFCTRALRNLGAGRVYVERHGLDVRRRQT